jgi:hypothetical protein
VAPRPLIDYLQRSYDVEITDDLSCGHDVCSGVDAVRAVRLTPAAADAAPLTFGYLGGSGLVVHAGLLHDFLFPVCGCDACDETWSSVADELEWNVQAVVSGGYREEVRGSEREPWIWHQLTAVEGARASSGGRDASAEAGPHLLAAAARLEAMPRGWAAWPARRDARGPVSRD